MRVGRFVKNCFDGNIGINFYLDPTAAGMTAADVTAADLDYSFAWADGNALVDVASQAATKTFRISKDGKYIIVSCKVCRRTMNCCFQLPKAARKSRRKGTKI